MDDTWKTDKQYQEIEIEKVSYHESDVEIKRSDGWCFMVPRIADHTICPGMKARFYGRGIGLPVRGLVVGSNIDTNGRVYFYRTEEQDEEYSKVERYGYDAADWLRRWDAGKTVWSIEMGGLGPGYEQAIHITAAEILRLLLATKCDHSQWDNPTKRKPIIDEINNAIFKSEQITKLGLSGAQYDAAFNLASNIYRRGPREALTDQRVKHRLIQVSKNFPS